MTKLKTFQKTNDLLNLPSFLPHEFLPLKNLRYSMRLTRRAIYATVTA